VSWVSSLVVDEMDARRRFDGFSINPLKAALSSLSGARTDDLNPVDILLLDDDGPVGVGKPDCGNGCLPGVGISD
jgi:hypothetical protein